MIPEKKKKEEKEKDKDKDKEHHTSTKLRLVIGCSYVVIVIRHTIGNKILLSFAL